MKYLDNPRFPAALARLSVAAAFGLALAAASPALAKNDKNNGNGNGNSAEHSKGNNGHANGNSGKKAVGEGASASDLGALNAAHASANALLHANPNSRVGKIAVFRNAVLETGVIQDERDAAQALLDTLPVPARGSGEISGDIDLAEIAKGDLEAKIAQLEADKLVEGADVDAIQAEIDAAQTDLDGVNGQLGDLNGELTDALAYEGAVSDVADLDAILADRPAIERALLEAAANKPVTDAVEAAVEELLGLN